MKQENWQKVKEVFYSALNRPESDRGAYLDDACSDDAVIRSEVELLLNSYERDFLEAPLWPCDASESSPAAPFLVTGAEFSHYQIVKLIGRGGMGEVYLANDTTLDRLVAIKIVHEGSGLGEKAERRLLREARAAARLDHPNICSVYEVGQTDGRPFIAMQYIEGETLDSRLSREPIGFEDSVLILRKIAAALSEAHSRGIIHRDIKPSNIMIDSRGGLRVLDFGLAKRSLMAASDSQESELSEFGIIAGTAAYMSPEQARGREIDARTDIWSLGVVFYQMITGRMPFVGETSVDVIAAILNCEFEPPGAINGDLNKNVNQIIERALQKDRDDRYASIDEFDFDLAAIMANPSFEIASCPVGISTRNNKQPAPRKSKFHLVRFAVIALILLLLTSVGLGIRAYRSSHSRSAAFSLDTAGKLQITKLFGVKRQIGGAVTDLNFSPDGKLIAFAISGNGHSAIYIKQPDGSEPVRITDGKAVDQTPVWSPDGQRIAFVSNREGRTALWVVSYLGGAPLLLKTLEGSPTSYHLKKWSNDGKRMFFESGGLKEIDLDTAQISTIDVSGISGSIQNGFAISSDETRLMIVSVENDKEILWMKSLTGSNAKRISETTHHSWGPSWFPDNQRIAYSSDQNGNFQIYVRDLDESEPRQVTFGDFNSSNPVVSPNGNLIAYISNIDEANIFSMELLAKKEATVTANVNMQLFPNISPDGRRIMYQRTDDGLNIFSSFLTIKLLDDESSPSIALSHRGCCARWSPNNEEIGYVRSAGPDHDIWKVGANDLRETRLTSGDVSMPGHTTAPFDLSAMPFEWSPDGSRVVFTSKKSGQFDVWTAAADGSGEQKLTNFQDGKTNALSPMWSPTGDRIAFIEATGIGPPINSRENRIAIYENGDVLVVTEFSAWVRLLGWARDGNVLFVAVAEDNYIDIYLVNANSNKVAKKILQLPDARRNGIRISPDQNWIAYAVRQGEIDNVFVLSMTGGKPRQVTSNDDSTLFYSGLTWSPDSKNLLYSRQTGGIQISLISTTN